jgi:hypothetical protein
MKSPPQPLDRLLQSAVRAHPTAVADAPGEPPPGFESRVAAEFNAARTEGEYLSIMHYLRPLLTAACLLIVIGAWLNLSESRNKTDNEAAYADTALRYQLLP